jgi:uncharacterized protein YndB with AHSA1/START domain
MSDMKEVVVSRVIDAPLEAVWNAWNEPARIKQWWGPQYFTSPSCMVDFRVGGAYLFCMQAPQGQQFFSAGTYQEIVPFEKIVYSDHLANEAGDLVEPSEYGMPEDWPREQIVQVTFKDEGGKTRLTVRQSRIPTGTGYDNAVMGWTQSLEKLAAAV